MKTLLNRSTFIVVLLGALAGTSCLRDGEVLAEYQGGKVTRGDVRMLFALIGRGTTDAKLEDQTQVLREIAITRIGAKEAIATGLDKNPEINKDMVAHEERSLLTSIDYTMRDDASSHKYRMLELQAVQLAAPDPAKRRAEAEDLMNKLNDKQLGDADIEKLASEKTENGRYRMAGGYLDPLCASCTPNPLAALTDPIEKAPERKFILVEAPGGFWIVRRLSVKEVKGSALKDVFESYHRKAGKIARAQMNLIPAADREKLPKDLILDEKQIEEISTWQAKEQERRELTGLLSGRIEAEKKARQFVLSPAAQPKQKPVASDYKDDTVLYSLNGKDFTFGLLKERLKSTMPDADVGVMLEILNGIIIPYEVMKDTKEAAKAKTQPVYAFVTDLRRDQVLANQYFVKNRGNDDVSEADIA
ncbi:MAG: hypothetical protein HY042_11750, partial [Spirochaetia bacterium]|nr:hypothetical protein [Spirochaetia bacterium]